MVIMHVISHSFIFLLLVTIRCTFTADNNKTSISTKILFQRDKPPIVEEPQTFVELVIKSNVFVDKSLLIKEILEDPNQIISITRPRQWGKSMNLDMLRIFFEVNVDSQGRKILPSATHPAYLLFVKGQVISKMDDDDIDKDSEDADELPPSLALRSPLLISKHQRIIDKHLGRHPVIYLDFSDFSGHNFQHMMVDLKERITYAIKGHAYLVQAFNAIIKQKNSNDAVKQLAQKRLYWYNDIISTDRIFSKSDLKVSVKTLVEVLHQYFNTTVFLLIDGYDVPFISTFNDNDLRPEEAQNFLTFYSAFLATTFKNNAASIKKAILTGVFPLSKEDNECTSDKIKLYDFLNTNYLQYYGFHQYEVEALFQQLNKGQHHRNFAAYYQFHDNSAPVYNPSAIVYHLSKNQKKLLHIEQLENIVRFFSAPNETKYKDQFNRVFEGVGAAVKLENLDGGHFTWKELQLLHNAMKYKHKNMTEIEQSLSFFQVDKLADKMLLFLYTIGYLSLTKCENKFTTQNYVCLKVHDEQMAKRLLCVIRSYGGR